MRYGILGDIHSNESALGSVLERLDAEAIEVLISVGDVVGYGAAPRECIELLRARDVVVVKGNHDAACVEELDERYFNNYARTAIRWTRAQLTPEHKEWLRSLPLVVDLEHCHVAHGTYFRPERFDYFLSPSDAEPSLDTMELPVCFVGHSHVPLTCMRLRDAPQRTGYTLEPEVDLRDAHRALVNVGSVGQPRDENPLAAYAVFDSEEGSVRIIRTPYDVEREASRIRAAGLPDVLAERLKLGL